MHSVASMISSIMAHVMAEVRASPSLLPAVLAGLDAAIISCALWTLIAIWTNMKFSIIAIAVGLFVGLSVNRASKEDIPMYGAIPLIISMVACVCGSFCSSVAILGKAEGLGFWEIFAYLDFSYFFNFVLDELDSYKLLYYFLIASFACFVGLDKKGYRMIEG